MKTWCKFSFQCNFKCNKKWENTRWEKESVPHYPQCFADQVKGRVFVSELEILMIDAITPNKEKL